MIDYAGMFSPKIDAVALTEFRTVLRGRYQQLQQLLPLDDTRAVLAAARTVSRTWGRRWPPWMRRSPPSPNLPSRMQRASSSCSRGNVLRRIELRVEKLATGRLRADQATKVFNTYGTVTYGCARKDLQGCGDRVFQLLPKGQ